MLDMLLVERFFVVPAFEIYGGVAGFYDFGPSGCAVRANVINLWRRHFVIEDGVLEIDCPTMMPAEVLKTSGHVDRFTDWMVRDLKTGDCLRADHLLEEHLEKLLENKKKPLSEADRAKVERDIGLIDDMCTKEALLAKYKEYGVTSPLGNELSEPYQFNLMFNTSIGPSGGKVGYMRPETAQGMFINFRRLYEYNGQQLPFGAAQIGRAFRNEIAPRQGLLRVREFDLAEIEFFCDPVDKRLAKFATVKDLKMRLLSRNVQSTTRKIEEMSIGEAVEKKIVGNETLAYFMARTQQFLVMCGLDPSRIRFRQHMASEMAHYASDCWDAEAQTSYGWVEIVGHADRSAYDLTVHAAKTKVENEIDLISALPT
jgi:glycyl-tRNA synthetase